MHKDYVKIEGFTRVQIEDGPTGKIVGDSGWRKNTIVNDGYLNYLCDLLGDSATSRQVKFIALGTGTAPGAAANTLDGEIMSSTQRKAPTYAAVASTTAQFTVSFNSVNSFLTVASNLSNVGLFVSSAENSIFAGNDYASSSCDTNQNVYVTYQIRFT